MKVPEKIYIYHYPTDGIYEVEDTKPLEGTIEYVNYNTFIEKVVKWLKEAITNNPECNRIISNKGVITMGEIIEDFKNYMKGE